MTSFASRSCEKLRVCLDNIVPLFKDEGEEADAPLLCLRPRFVDLNFTHMRSQ